MEGDQAMSNAEAMDEGKRDALLTSDTMIEAMKATGDPEAWKRFLKIYGPLMVRWNTDHGVQPADAADVAQEIALYVFNNIHRFDRRHPGAFRAWLRAIAHNKIRRMRETRAIWPRRFWRRERSQSPTIYFSAPRRSRTHGRPLPTLAANGMICKRADGPRSTRRMCWII